MKPSIRLDKMAPPAISTLWEQGHDDADWPRVYQTFPQFRDLAEHQNTAELLGEGLVRRVVASSDEDRDVRPSTAGFVLLNHIPEHLWDGPGVAVEGGSYLLPEFRGKGMNGPLKQATAALAIQVFRAQWCVFAVPVANVRAQRAIEKLEFGIKRTVLEDHGPFQKYLKRRIWETGEYSVLYVWNLGVISGGE